MIHTLLKPYFYAVRHRLGAEINWRSHATRDVVLAGFAVAIMVAIYSGSKWMLEKITEYSAVGYLPPSHILSLILMTLFFMLLASGVAIAFGTLFHAQDMELILSSPVNRHDFFFGKLFSVLLASSWMPVVFISPLIIAFGQFYHTDSSFFFASVLAILPYFAIPSAIAIPLAIGFVMLVPSNRNREALILILVAFLYAMYALVDFITGIEASGGGASEIFRIVSILSAHNVAWLPSNWLSAFLSNWLEPGENTIKWLYLLLLYLVSASLIALAYLAFTILHFRAFTRAQNLKQASTITTQHLRILLKYLCPFISPQWRALLEKEIKTVTRDISQIVQIVMLTTICVVYLYNLKIFTAFESVPVGDKDWWQKFLYGSNIAIGAFITTAISTRFIFPSISLEGRSFWILQKAPIEVKDVLRAKFLCWLPPVTLVSCILFGAGAYAVKASVVALVLNIVAGIFISMGIVGMAVGLGAVFANFSWEHSSQLSAGLGNFLFMLCSTFMIFINTGFVALTLVYWNRAFDMNQASALAFVTVTLAIMSVTNAATAKLSIDLGARSLERLLEHGS